MRTLLSSASASLSHFFPCSAVLFRKSLPSLSIIRTKPSPHRGGGLHDKGRVSCRYLEEVFVDAVKVLRQLCPDLVPDEDIRLVLEPPFWAGGQYEHQEVGRTLLAKDVIELIAKVERRVGRLLDCTEDELVATYLQERHVTIVLVCSPPERL
jgi:hypothetical protein